MVVIIDTPKGRMNIVKAAQAFGIARGTLAYRRFLGHTGEKLFRPPMTKQGVLKQPRNQRYWSAYGRITFKQASQLLDMPASTIAARVSKYGWSLTEAFNTPQWARPGTKFIIDPDEYQRRLREQMAKGDAV